METALLDGRLWMTTTDLITEESFCLAWLVRDVRWRTEELIWDNVATMNYHLCYFKAGTDNAQRKLELHALQDTGYQDNPGPLGNQRHWLFSSDISYLALPVKAERWRMPFSSTVHQLTCRATWGVAHRLTLFFGLFMEFERTMQEKQQHSNNFNIIHVIWDVLMNKMN